MNNKTLKQKPIELPPEDLDAEPPYFAPRETLREMVDRMIREAGDAITAAGLEDFRGKPKRSIES